jgi:large subunit ribosomal protein L25
VSEVRLAAEVRTVFGKGGARRTRRAGRIPAVIYGHGADPRHVSLPAREFAAAIKHGGANVLLTIALGDRDELTIPKAIQRHPIRGEYEHVDLLSVRRGEKVTIVVPLLIIGEVAPGGLLAQEATSVALEADATALPTEIEVSVQDAQIGAHVTAGDLTLPAGSTLITDPETLLVHVGAAPTAEDVDAEISAAAGELGIVEDKPAEATAGVGRAAATE